MKIVIAIFKCFFHSLCLARHTHLVVARIYLQSNLSELQAYREFEELVTPPGAYTTHFQARHAYRLLRLPPCHNRDITLHECFACSPTKAAHAISEDSQETFYPLLGTVQQRPETAICA